MTAIKILNASLVEQDTIDFVLGAQRFESINGDNGLNFSLPLDSAVTAIINSTNVIGYGTDYFDIAKYTKGQNGGGIPIVQVECEHISYRLNNSAYDKDYFTEIGTPNAVLTKILEGTGFSVGTVEFSTTLTYSAQQKMSRRGLLMEFIALLGGEGVFNGFTISIVAQRGSTTPKDLTATQNITVLSKAMDKRTLDDSGNPTVSYQCAIYNPTAMAVGDVVTLSADLLEIDVTLRIVRVAYNPYDDSEIEIEIGNYVNALEDDLYRIETDMVAKGAKYYGARISAENGFESIRNDNKARAVFNADLFSMQAWDDALSAWKDKLYFDPVTGKYIFDGELSATLITALEAQFDITISNTTITNILSAGNADIAQLTVDRLETSQKVQKYLSSDTSDVNYIRAQGEAINFITASVSSGTSQAEDRFGSPLYWLDAEHTGATTTVTEWPVTVYNYTEYTKMTVEFYNNGTDYVPRLVLGTGSGVGDIAKGFIEKIDGGMKFRYVKYDGTPVEFVLGEDGIGGTNAALSAITIGASTMQTTYADGTVYNWTFAKDGAGKFTSITNTTTGQATTVTWS